MKLSIASVVTGGVAVTVGIGLVAGAGFAVIVAGAGLVAFGLLRDAGDPS